MVGIYFYFRISNCRFRIANHNDVHEKIAVILPMPGRSLTFLTVGRIAWLNETVVAHIETYPKPGLNLLDICSFFHSVPDYMVLSRYSRFRSEERRVGKECR